MLHMQAHTFKPLNLWSHPLCLLLGLWIHTLRREYKQNKIHCNGKVATILTGSTPIALLVIAQEDVLVLITARLVLAR